MLLQLSKKAVSCAVVGMLLIALTPFVFAQVAAKLKQTNFEDGTGQHWVWLPAGTLKVRIGEPFPVRGPNGGAMVMKLPWAIIRPESSVAQLPASQQQPMAPAGDLGAGLREVLRKKVGATLIKARGRRLAEVSPGSPAYLLFYEYQQNGTTYTAMGYFAALDYGPDQPFWQLYSSAMVAPKEQFAKLAPTMIQMWKSWRPNGQPPTEGSSSAIFDKVMKDHRASYDQIQKEFREQL